MNSKSTRDIIALLCFYVYLAILILKKITHVAFLTKKNLKPLRSLLKTHQNHRVPLLCVDEVGEEDRVPVI